MPKVQSDVDIVIAGIAMWKTVLALSGACKNISLAEIKDHCHRYVSEETGIVLRNNCAGCTIYYDEDWKCKRRCKVAKECKLFCNNSQETDSRLIAVIAEIMIEKHESWLKELEGSK